MYMKSDMGIKQKLHNICVLFLELSNFFQTFARSEKTKFADFNTFLNDFGLCIHTLLEVQNEMSGHKKLKTTTDKEFNNDSS